MKLYFEDSFHVLNKSNSFYLLEKSGYTRSGSDIPTSICLWANRHREEERQGFAGLSRQDKSAPLLRQSMIIFAAYKVYMHPKSFQNFKSNH